MGASATAPLPPPPAPAQFVPMLRIGRLPPTAGAAVHTVVAARPQGGVRFQSSVEELRFQESQSDGQGVRHRLGGSWDSWRATTTPEGTRYFYNARTGEACSQRPEELVSRSVAVGDKVAVYSNSKGCWCNGYVERVVRRRDAVAVTAAFQLPGFGRDKWHKKELPLLHPELRLIREDEAGLASPTVGDDEQQVASEISGCNSPSLAEAFVIRQGALGSPPAGFPEPVAASLGTLQGTLQGTLLPRNWDDAELQLYDRLFEELAEEDAAEPLAARGRHASAESCADLLRHCGLARRVLKEIWQVSNPELHAALGREEFRTCCRLVAHCQALQHQASASGHSSREATALHRGRGLLRELLRGHAFLGLPPERLPEFGKNGPM